MIINIDEYRKSNVTCAAERGGYFDRSSYDEEMLSAHWAKAERLMQSLNVSWNQAIRIINLTSDKSRQELSPQLPENFSGVDVDAFLDRVYALATLS